MRSRAADLLQNQLGTKMSAGLVWQSNEMSCSPNIPTPPSHPTPSLPSPDKGRGQNQPVNLSPCQVPMAQPTSSFTFNTNACPMKWLSQYISYIMTTSPPLLHVVAWCPKGSEHKEHWDPADVFMPSHHLIAVWHSSGSRCKHWPGVGTIESHEEEYGADTDNSLALLARELLLSKWLSQ